MPTIPYLGVRANVSDGAFVAPDAWIIGDVHLADGVTVLFSAVLRGDIQPIRVGAGTNIQEHALLHTSNGMDPVTVGINVTIGHRAILHGCTVSDHCIIGMGATILDNAVIGAGSIVGAHTLIPKGKTFPPRSLIMGMPGRAIREITEVEYAGIVESALNYQKTGKAYREIFNAI